MPTSTPPPADDRSTLQSTPPLADDRPTPTVLPSASEGSLVSHRSITSFHVGTTYNRVMASYLWLPKQVAILFFWVFLVFVLFVGMGSAQLSDDYYSSTCPDVLTTIESAVETAVSNEARMGASLLRLHFHDCFVNASLSYFPQSFSLSIFLNLLTQFSSMLVFEDSQQGWISSEYFLKQGCDGSVLLDDTANFTGEKTAIPNNSLRGFDVIDTIKSQVESVCPGIVSCADILAVAARDSVVALGGPSWTVQLGRRDSTTASLTAANNNIPAPTLNLSGLITAFSNKGFSANEMVALSGSHTIGQARCISFRARIYNETNIDSQFATSLQSNCPSTGGDNNLSPLDTTSPTSFNNAYFTNLQSQLGLLHSDQQLFNGGSTDSQVDTYSSDSDTFFNDFANAMVKMGSLSPLTGTSGQIRANCRKTN
ncbi:hypothetical protein RHSIM_Rhsim04G0123000 [Rhododendron simsii]|uniref:peroxidase n=1 Tax=Rhododendron simsii TaxID=118357 RepID=A0A834LSN9_RHOSS|nr:hypothetical protein RHSIM_Rhsim04G0123000 [Rhododendron simsii]